MDLRGPTSKGMEGRKDGRGGGKKGRGRERGEEDFRAYPSSKFATTPLFATGLF